MTSEPGTYALVLKNRKAGALQVGRLGTMKLQPGYYVYVGSAFGAGGLAARVQHHCRIAVRPHWHIDYLRASCELIAVWFTTEAVCREHEWTKAVAQLVGASVPMLGFGSSDCDCAAHLFHFRRLPFISDFCRLVKHARVCELSRQSANALGMGHD